MRNPMRRVSLSFRAMIAREPESETLLQAFRQAAGGSCRFVLLQGESGVGKTRLMEEAIKHSGLCAWVGRATEEARGPYAPLVGALRQARRSLGTEAWEAFGLKDVVLSLFPENREPTAISDRELLWEAIAQLLEAALVTKAAVVCLEDMHWSDDASLEILPHLVDRLRDAPLAFCLTCRPEDLAPTHLLRRLRLELKRQRQLVEVKLKPFSREETAALAAEVLGEGIAPGLMERLQSRSEGLPLLVEEICASLAESGRLRPGDNGLELPGEEELPLPETLKDATLLRLDGLEPAQRELLALASVAGVEPELDLLRRAGETATGGAEPGIGAAGVAFSDESLERLLEQGFLRPAEAGRVRFRHAFTRDAVRSSLTWSERRACERRLAEALESMGGPPERIAAHWMEAQEPARAREPWLQAAERACGLHAYGEAAAFGKRALDVWPEGDGTESEAEARLEALKRFAHCSQVSGALSEADRAWREVIQSPVVRCDALRLGFALRALADVQALQGHWEQVLRTREESAQAFLEAGAREEAAVELLALAARRSSAGRLEAAEEVAGRAAALAAEAQRPGLQARAMAFEGNITAMRGRVEPGVARIREALALALGGGEAAASAEVYRRLGSALEYAADYRASVEAYQSALEVCRAEGEAAQARLCYSCMSYALLQSGDWARCRSVCRELLQEAGAQKGARAFAEGLLSLLHALKGEWKSARKLHAKAMPTFRKSDSVASLMILHWVEGLLEQNEARPEAAAECYLRLLDIWQGTEDVHDAIPGLLAAVIFFADRGGLREVSRCADAFAGIAARSGSHEALASLALALGEASLMRDRRSEALEQFDKALAHLEKLEAPVFEMLFRHRAGRAKARCGEHEAADALLDRAYRIGLSLGARPESEAILQSLSDFGLPSRVGRGRSEDGPRREAQAGLSRRQLEIARLLTEGLSNKEMADKLFLSPRTVEMHVAHILDRLDCRSRAEAAHRVTELGLA